MVNPLRHFIFTRRNVIAFFAAPLFVFGWHMVVGGGTARQGKILAEFGLIKKVVDVPQPNHAGTKLLFAQDTEKGLEFYLYDFSTDGSRLLFEIPAEIYKPEQLQNSGLVAGRQVFRLFPPAWTKQVLTK